MDHDRRRAALALLILRLTLGLFLLQWSLEKFIVPASTVKITQTFYAITITDWMSYVLGALELLLTLALLAGAFRRPVYAVSCVLHAVSVAATWRQLLDPFGLAKVGNHLFIAGIPVLGAFVLLYMLRNWDIYSVDGFRRGNSAAGQRAAPLASTHAS